MTSAGDYGKVWDHLRARDGSNEIRGRTFGVREFSAAPFTVYVHKQETGDLLVIPPRWCEVPRRLTKVDIVHSCQG